MTLSPVAGQNCLPTPSLILLETPPPLACLHCAATQATVRRDRQILDARLDYRSDCVCCDCETGNACPNCLGENLEYGTYDFGPDRETGYADSGEIRDGPFFVTRIRRRLSQPVVRRRGMAKMLPAGLVALVVAAGAPAQPVPPPTAYSATMLVTLSGPAIYGKKVYRDGARMMVEQFQDTPDPIGAFLAPTVQAHRSRVYYNLDTHQWFGTDPNEGPSTALDRPASVSPNCRTGTFQNLGDDPFEHSARLMEEFNRQNPVETGTATLNGFSTRIIESTTGAGKTKIWLDTKYGVIVKAESQGKLLFELKKLTVERPKASLLTEPSYCAFAVATP